MQILRGGSHVANCRDLESRQFGSRGSKIAEHVLRNDEKDVNDNPPKPPSYKDALLKGIQSNTSLDVGSLENLMNGRELYTGSLDTPADIGLLSDLFEMGTSLVESQKEIVSVESLKLFNIDSDNKANANKE